MFSSRSFVDLALTFRLMIHFLVNFHIWREVRVMVHCLHAAVFALASERRIGVSSSSTVVRLQGPIQWGFFKSQVYVLQQVESCENGKIN